MLRVAEMDQAFGTVELRPVSLSEQRIFFLRVYLPEIASAAVDDTVSGNGGALDADSADQPAAVVGRRFDRL